VEALLLDHGTPSAAYVVRETPRVNIDPGRLAASGLRPGPWLKRLQDPGVADAEVLVVEGASRAVGALRAALTVTTPGDSVAYLTDFLLDEAALALLGEALRGIGTVVCEAQYADADRELAVRNRHLTARLAATLAARAGVGQLVLFHLSDRYRPEGWRALLAEARAVFPNTRFPEPWSL
jgi:ribonuclease Z